MDDEAVLKFGLRGGLIELGKGPGLTGGKIAQGEGMGPGADGVLPEVVKHCQCGSRAVVYDSSMMWMIGEDGRRGQARAGRAWCLVVWLALLAVGCAAPRGGRGLEGRDFTFEEDTFAYANELVWEYGYDDRGRWRGRPREPRPDYTHRCFVMVRVAKQFWLHGQFEADLARVDDLTYRRLIREVIRSSPRRGREDEARVVIPGYGDLREFSEAWGGMLRAESGGAWQSYWQRGHWRVVIPFSRRHQERVAERLVEALELEGMTVAHLVRFPRLSINHAVVVYGFEDQEERGVFRVYDPNEPAAPLDLTYCGVRRQFEFPRTAYYPGGRVDVYEIYRGVCY
jgi:hypothetical protein